MGLAMIAPTAVFVPLCLAGLLPDRAALAASMTLMPLAMLADMGYRWREYAQHEHGAMTASVHWGHTDSAPVMAEAEVPPPEHESTATATPSV